MDNKQKAKRFREYSKKAYKDTKAFQDRCFNMFFYNEVVRHTQLETELDTPEFKEKLFSLKFSYLRGWGAAEKIFGNAGVADLLDVQDNLGDALREIRILKKHSQNAEAINAYNNSLNIVKEVLSKIPNRLLFSN